MKKVGISIVNYNTAPLVIDCIAALEHMDKPEISISVAIVDNCSSDDSLKRLEAFAKENQFSFPLQVIPAERNGGFSYGNNVALSYIEENFEYDFFWLLNPDTKPDPEALDKLLAFLDATPDAGIAGSKLKDPDGTPQIAAFNYPTPFGQFVNGVHLGIIARMFPRYLVAQPLPETTAKVDWVAGASMLVKREVIQTVGRMDETYFLYFEEVDYCMRAKEHNFNTYYVPTSEVLHYVGSSTGISETRVKMKRRPAYWFLSRRHFFVKNYGVFSAFLADLFWLSAQIFKSLRHLIQRKENLDPPYFIRDFLKHSMFIPRRRSNG